MTAAMPMGTAHAPTPMTPDYPARAAMERRPLFGALDIAGIAAAAVMALLPLTAYAVGL